MDIVNKIKGKFTPLSAENRYYKWALILVVSRCVLLLFFQGLLASFFYFKGIQNPWGSAAKWWTVYGTAVDLSCLLLLFFALKAEGKELLSLLDFSKKKFLKDVKNGLLVAIVIFPLLGFLFSIWTASFIFNESTLELILGRLAERRLPAWAYYYSITFWWVIWSVTEEMTYQGFGLPRLLGRYGRIKVILFIAFFWALQHSFLPLLLDWRYILWRFVSFFPLVLALIVSYLKIGRLTPIIFAHALMDIMAAIWTFEA